MYAMCWGRFRVIGLYGGFPEDVKGDTKYQGSLHYELRTPVEVTAAAGSSTPSERCSIYRSSGPFRVHDRMEVQQTTVKATADSLRE